jgi:hypothetical protein
MSEQLTEEEMRQALFGSVAPSAPVIEVPVQAAPVEVVAKPPVKPAEKKKPAKVFTPRLRVILRVGNEFEGATQEIIHEADTLSALLAEQDATKAARKKFKYVEVVSVQRM